MFTALHGRVAVLHAGGAGGGRGGGGGSPCVAQGGMPVS